VLVCFFVVLGCFFFQHSLVFAGLLFTQSGLKLYVLLLSLTLVHNHSPWSVTHVIDSHSQPCCRPMVGIGAMRSTTDSLSKYLQLTQLPTYSMPSLNNFNVNNPRITRQTFACSNCYRATTPGTTTCSHSYCVSINSNPPHRPDCLAAKHAANRQSSSIHRNVHSCCQIRRQSAILINPSQCPLLLSNTPPIGNPHQSIATSNQNTPHSEITDVANLSWCP
jgi:hypothetical protein